MFDSIGTFKYSESPYKLVVLVDQDISDYYRSMIPKYNLVGRQKFPAHITVVRNETPINLNQWGLHNNEKINFHYYNTAHNDDTYWWLEVESKTLEDMRNKLGLPNTSEFTRSPDGRHNFHITIGNTKKAS